MLSFTAWLCLKDNALSGSQMCIVTGSKIDLAIALIDRMKKLFIGKIKVLLILIQKETVIQLNNVKIEVVILPYYETTESVRQVILENCDNGI
jgi:hypothetical protein